METVVYLDSSAIVKRYVKEAGSAEVKETYLRAYSGDRTLAYSIWNIGEVLGALDRAARMKRLEAEDHATARIRFVSETRRMAKRGMASIVSVKSSILGDAWRLLEEKHLYEADALQLATANHVKADSFLTADSGLHGAAREMDFNSTLLG